MSRCFRLHGQIFLAETVPDWIPLLDGTGDPRAIMIDIRGACDGIPAVHNAPDWIMLPPVLPVSSGFDLFRRGLPDRDETWMLRVTGANGARLWLHLDPADHRLTVWWSTDGDPVAIRRFLFTIGLSWICRLTRRRLCLHAAAVALHGGGVVICGDTGQGKSTLAAILIEGGASPVAADMASVDVIPGPVTPPPVLLGGVPLDDDRLDAVTSPVTAPPTLPLKLVIVLAPRGGDQPARLDRLDARAAVPRLAGLVYPRGIMMTRSLAAADLARLAGLVQMVPCYRLTRPDDVGALADQAAMIETVLDAA